MVPRTGKQLIFVLVLALSLLGGFVHAALAASLLSVSINTSLLSGTDGQLAFDLVDGDGTINNMVTISNFSTDGALGSFSFFGGATGALPGATTIEDTDFFNEFLQEITLGNSINFTLELTRNFVGGLVPDQFSFFLLDELGTSSLVSTMDPTGADALFVIDIAGRGLRDLQVFTPIANVAVVPEPGTLLLAITGLLGFALYRRLI